MEILEKTDKKVIFLIKNREVLMNAIRRYLNRVSVLAIDEVEISKNDSPLYDETLAHRLGLVPLKMEKNHNEKTTGELKLESKEEGYVYSEGLNGDIEVVEGRIPLTFLNKGQRIELKATIKAGEGVDHSKFSPGILYYRHVSEITLDKSLQDEVKIACPNCNLKEKDGKIIIIDNRKTEVCDVCEGISAEAGKKSETKVKDELVVTLESFGQLETEEILKRSIEKLKKDLKELSKKLK